ncbi:MAG TPA: head-tail adaptor protein [Actinokineospora sp.]|nr:head-tail adaptor protein [Actinokineospora sp.]
MIGHLLNRAAEVWRRSEVDDGIGGRDTLWVKVAAVRARFSQPGVAERDAGPTNLGDLTHQVYLAPGADVRRGDQVRDGALVLRVMAVLTPSAEIYLRADCEQLQAEGA